MHAAQAAHKVTNNLINVPDQYTSNYLRNRSRKKRAVVFLYLCCFIRSSLQL